MHYLYSPVSGALLSQQMIHTVMASPPAAGQQLALDIMYFSVEHPGCMYAIPTGAASVVEKSLADVMCGLFGDSLSPLQPANVAEREYVRYLNNALQDLCGFNKGPDSSMRLQATRLSHDVQTAVWVRMAKVFMELRVELAQPGSQKWKALRAELREAAAADSAAVIRVPATLGADTASIDRLNKHPL
jgi:hypothetical protein